MMRRTTLFTALLLALVAGPVGADTGQDGPVTVCHPASAIRQTLPEPTEARPVRAAPAHGSCRNTAAPRRSERVDTRLAAVDGDSVVVCKPGSAIRYRVSALPESGPWRPAGPGGSCRIP